MPGPLMLIGGAEDKLRSRTILREFVALAGGADARIAVIPTASSLGHEVVGVYEALFGQEGASEVSAVRPESREEAHDADLVRVLAQATGIFITGGNQLKLSALIGGTPLGDAIVAAHQRGVVVAGTSAGASIQSSHMVAFGGPGATPKQRMTQVGAGLGLLRSSVVDQHFDQRNRYGRLLMIVAQSPQLLGIGVDEDTAGVVERLPDPAADPSGSGAPEEGDEPRTHEVLRVIGRGAVTVFDPARITTNAHEAKRSQPLLASGVVLHSLPAGASFDLTTRTLVPPRTEVDPEDAAEAGEDLRRLARDIAAADVSRTTLRRRLARKRRPVRPAGTTTEPGAETGPEDGGPPPAPERPDGDTS